jgi:hypothetical protein
MRDIWISLFIFGVIFFNWPVISLFEHGIAKYLFAAWFLFIALVVIAVEYKKKNDNGG